MARDDSAPDLGFRTATASDVDDVVALVEAAYRDKAKGGWTSESHLLDGQRTDVKEVASLLERPSALVLLAEAGGRLVGCCHVEAPQLPADGESPAGGPPAYFGMFAVRPDTQGIGVGRALLTEAKRQARRWGRSQLRMTVIRQREDLIAWYERLGFRRTGETEPFPYGDERFGRPLTDDLEFVVLVGPTA